MCATTDDTKWSETAQARLMHNDVWEQEIVSRLPANLEEQAKVLGALQRRRGIKQASQLLRAVLSWILCQRSLRQLGVWAVLLGIADLSDTAWRKRLARVRRLAQLAAARSTGSNEREQREAKGDQAHVAGGWHEAPAERRELGRMGGSCKSPTISAQERS